MVAQPQCTWPAVAPMLLFWGGSGMLLCWEAAYYVVPTAALAQRTAELIVQLRHSNEIAQRA